MKLPILLAVLIALAFGASLRADLYGSIEIGNDVKQIRSTYADSIYCDYPTLFAIEDGQGVVVVTTDGTSVQSVTRFSAQARFCSSKGIEPIAPFDASELVGRTAEEMVELLGPPHADLGSGVYLFSYVMRNGTVTYFCSTNKTISSAGAIDLFLRE
jgi:ribosomal protein L24E